MLALWLTTQAVFTHSRDVGLVDIYMTSKLTIAFTMVVMCLQQSIIYGLQKKRVVTCIWEHDGHHSKLYCNDFLKDLTQLSLTFHVKSV